MDRYDKTSYYDYVVTRIDGFEDIIYKISKVEVHSNGILRFKVGEKIIATFGPSGWIKYEKYNHHH
jgi:hypothetical protein